MPADSYPDLLIAEGFQRIGSLEHELRLSVWWNLASRLQILLMQLGELTLLKGDKSYHLKSVTTDGETWARDIGSLHDYLETHFPEIRLSFSHFRDLPVEIADAEARRRMALDSPAHPVPSIQQIGRLQREFDAAQHASGAVEQLLNLSDGDRDLLSGYVAQQARSQRSDLEQRRRELEGQQRRYDVLEQLRSEYRRKGSGAVFTFSVSSNIQIANDLHSFRRAIQSVVSELSDHHRLQVHQKLQGGRLKIQIAEAEDPTISWIEQWFGGALCPIQLHRLLPPEDPLRSASDSYIMVTPDEPILIDGHARHHEKHIAARFVSDIMSRLDQTDAAHARDALDPDRMTVKMMPLQIGHRIDDAGRVIGPAVLPLNQIVHAAICGTTGAGKSYLARVLVEEAAGHEKLSILVLDPRNQFAGTLIAEDRLEILNRYSEFGMNPRQARGFAFNYHGTGLDWVPPLPQRPSALSSGRNIVSFKGSDDTSRCNSAGDVLDAVFSAVATAESTSPRLLIVIDEAQLFTQKRVDETARSAAARAERAIDRIAREGRKYGIVMILVSQTIKDFSYHLASLRQMATTKIFLRNSDREIEYADDVLGDGRQLVQLPTGSALLHNANWGIHRIQVRPPYSKVFELPDDELRQILHPEQGRVQSVSGEAKDLIAIIQTQGQSINLTQLATLAGISSRRRLHDLVDELELAGLIRTHTLPERGKPRMIELISPETQDEKAPATPTP